MYIICVYTYIYCRVGTQNVHTPIALPARVYACAFARVFSHSPVLADVPPIAPLADFLWTAFNKSARRTFEDATGYRFGHLRHSDISRRSLSSYGPREEMTHDARSQENSDLFANIMSLTPHVHTPRSQSMGQRRVRVNPFAIPSVHMFSRVESRDAIDQGLSSRQVRGVIILR